MSRQTMRLPPRCGWKRTDSLERCARSITKIRSAHCSSSGVSGLSAPTFSPADAVSMPGQFAKTCSAVGLRRRFWLQRKSTLRAIVLRTIALPASVQGLAPLGDGMHEIDRNAVRTQYGRDLSLPRLEMLVLAFQLLAALVRAARRVGGVTGLP